MGVVINIQIYQDREGVGAKALVTQTVIVGPYVPSEVKVLGTVHLSHKDIGQLLEMVQKLLFAQGIEKVGDEG